MKIFRILFCILFFCPLVHGAVVDDPVLYPQEHHLYPGRIADFSQSDYSGFLDVYKNIYQDVHDEENDEVIRRVREHMFWVEDGLETNQTQEWLVLQSQIAQLCNLDVPLGEASQNVSLSEHTALATSIRYICQQEKELLRLQDNLARRETFRTLFSNDLDASSERKSDSPFDVIEDLHMIDQILYGEKFDAQRPEEPTFAWYEFFEDWGPVPEFWQNQTKEGIQELYEAELADKDYIDTESSIDGVVFEIHSILEFLASVPLGGENVNKEIMSTTQHKGTSGEGAGASPQKTESAPPDPSKPEYKTVHDDNLWSKFKGLIDDVLNENRVEEVIDDIFGVRNFRYDFEDIRRGEQRRRDSFSWALRQIEETQERRANDEHFGSLGTPRIDQSLIDWNKNLEAFLDHAEEIHSIFKNILIPKPQL